MGWERTASRSQKKETPAGCMSGFLQLFDLHQRLFRATTAFPSDLEEQNSPQGVVAPRNSLKLEEVATIFKDGEDDYYDIPMSISLVVEKEKKKTQKLQELDMDFRSDELLKPKTGNVVARLMGLEQIPDQTPSRSSDSYTSQEQLSTLKISASHKLLRESSMTPPPLRQRNSNSLAEHGTRSLPETPRASSARKSADADPRLSLQISFKENLFIREDVSLLPSPKLSKPKRRISSVQTDENRSPRQYASDIVKQVKESVSKRMARRRFENPPPENKKKKTVLPPRLPPLELPKNRPVKPIPPRSDGGRSKDLQSERFVGKIKKLPPQRVNYGEVKALSCGNSLSGSEEYFYVRCMLERTGVRNCTPRSVAAVKWYSPSHPLDPLVFHQLERSFQRSSGTLRHRCNRKLLFNLADELLADILWPFLHSKPWEEQWRRSFALSGSESIAQRLWNRIRCAAAGAAAELETVVAADLAAGNVRMLLEHPAMSRETESLVSDLESFIFDSLVDEIYDVINWNGDISSSFPSYGPGRASGSESSRTGRAGNIRVNKE